jgi:predicted transposase/invertase (TIGR01784 family)
MGLPRRIAGRFRICLGLIETVLVYKFAQWTPQELEAMFGLNELRQTRYFQEVEAQSRERGFQQGKQEGKQEGKLEAVPGLVKLGLSVEQIAEALGLTVKQVQQARSGDRTSVTEYRTSVTEQRPTEDAGETE